MGGSGVVLQPVLSPPNFKIFMGTRIECMTTAHDSSYKTTHGLTKVMLEFGSLCTYDGSQHLHVFFGSCMCSPSAVMARKWWLEASSQLG